MAIDALVALAGAEKFESAELANITPVQEAFCAVRMAWPDMDAHGDCGEPDCPVCLTYGRALDKLLSREPQSQRDVAKQLRGALAFRSPAMAQIAFASELTPDDKRTINLSGDERFIWASIFALEGGNQFAKGKSGQ